MAAHCDELILHKPGSCVYCDKYPELQADRERNMINFTGEYDPVKELCPSQKRRKISDMEKWGGNVAKTQEDIDIEQATWDELLDNILKEEPFT